MVWIGLGSYARVLGLLYLFYGLAFLAAPARRTERPVETGMTPRIPPAERTIMSS